jgi:cell division protein FtsZ
MEIKPEVETFAKIKVIGVGGSGNSAVNRMILSKIRGVEFVAVNTDAQALHHNESSERIHIGQETTRGLGAGMDPDKGRGAAEESQDELEQVIAGTDMVFITCGLGGGTGTGASPIIADIARRNGALTVAVITKPFTFEGAQRKFIAEQGLQELADKVDTIITIPNDRLLQIIDKKTSLIDAFSVVDEVLRQGVQGISEIITVPGLINVDFADVKAIMSEAGSALMGIGRGSGESRAVEAAKAAINSPLLEMSIDGAKGILFTVSGGADLGMYEVNEAASVITQSADPNAKVIFGAIVDETLGDEVKVTVIATGFTGQSFKRKDSDKKVLDSVAPSDTTAKVTVEAKPESAKARVDEEPLSPSRKYARPLTPAAKTTDQKKSEEEEELEIPAFIRKKMM